MTPVQGLRALVTGATGFIGTHLTTQLLARGAESVRVLVLPREDITAPWASSVDVVRGDITDARAVDAAASDDIDVIFHLAALVGDAGSRAQHERVTVGGSQNVYRAALRNSARVVLTSSVVVYGDGIGRDVCDEHRPFGQPQGPYSRAKQAQERNAWKLVSARDLKLSVVRPTNVYGPGSRPWVDQLCEQLRKGLPALIGDGSQNAGLVHVDNLVDLILLAGTHDEALGRVYNGCDELDVSWRRYTTDLARILGAPEPRSMPASLARILARISETIWPLLPVKGRPPVTREAINLVGSHHQIPSTRARLELGWTPTVDYRAGLASVEQYLRSSAQ